MAVPVGTAAMKTGATGEPWDSGGIKATARPYLGASGAAQIPKRRIWRKQMAEVPPSQALGFLEASCLERSCFYSVKGSL